MRALLDTSATFAYLDADAIGHDRVVPVLDELAEQRALVMHSHLVIETISLLQNRLGLAAVQDFIVNLEPACDVVWVDPHLHRRAVAALITADRRQVSLVDHVSFLVMRERGLEAAVTLDHDFADRGFAVLPG